MVNYPKVSIVTPIHNGIEYTQTFLKSLKKVTYPNFEIIIIDDGSTDGSVEIIKKKYPEVKILNGDGNLWWSGATNLGVKQVLKDNISDYILTINNDVEVTPNFLTHLIECAQEYPKSLIGSKIYELKTKKLWYAGGLVNWNKGIFYHNLKLNKNIFVADWLTGMGALIKTDIYQKIGLYDGKRFPQYAGDLEFSIRAKKNGYKLLVCTKSIIYNNIESCGNIKYGKKLTSWLVLKSLFAMKSDTNLKLRYHLYKNYSPTPFRSFLGFYKYYFRESISIILKSRKK